MDLLNIIYLAGLIQGFSLSLALLVKTAGKKQQNLFFIALIFIISLALLAKFLFDRERYMAFPHFWFFVDLTAFTIGPLWYFTIAKSIQPKVKLNWQEAGFLSPILYHIAFLIYLLSLSRADLLGSSREPWFVWNFYAFCLAVLIVNTAFLLKSRQLLKKHRDARFPPLLVRGQFLFLGILGAWLASFLLSFAFSNGYQINLNAYHFAFISLSFLAFGMAFLALVRPASFYFLTQTFDGSETYVLQQIAERAVRYLQGHQPYLNKDYSLQMLSSDIASNPVLTSKAINRILKTNFNELLNEQRVRHFLQLAREEEAKRLTLWAIAQNAGFGNKVTFYKSFKKQMGTTPKVYLEQHF